MSSKRVFKHSRLTLESISNSNINYINNILLGEVIICFSNKEILAKVTNNELVIVGNSARKLVDLLDYIQGVESSNEAYALVKIKFPDPNNIDLNQLYFTTDYPFLSITDLQESTITTNIPYNYLAVTLNSQLESVIEHQFKLEQLLDVNISSQLTSNYDTYALTYIAGNYTTNDYFSPNMDGSWILKPETSKLALLEDIEYNTPSNGWLIKNIPAIEESSNIDRTSSLHISWDSTPVLGNSLNCNYNSIINLYYSVDSISLNSIQETINLYLNNYSLFYINCNSSVQILTLNLIYDFDINISSMIMNNIILDNFTGIIQFNSYIQYENGIAPQLIEPCNILNLLTYQGDSSIITKVLQKGISLANVDSI